MFQEVLARARNKPKSRKILSLVYLVVVIAGLWLLYSQKPMFFSVSNIQNILIQASATGIMTFGMSFVLITCGMDLSITQVMLFSSVAGAVVMQKTGSVFLGVLTMILAGVLCGCVNGISVARFKMYPFIVTMSTMIVTQAAATLISNSRTIPTLPAFSAMANAKIIGIPIPIILLVAAGIVFHILLTKTPFGRSLYAVGINPEATTPCGIPTRFVLFSAYVISSLTAAIAGIILTSKLGSASLSTASDSANMDVICAAILGGVSIYGGKGNIIGPLFGVLFIVAMQNAFNLFGVNYFISLVVKGAIILIITLSDTVLSDNRRA